MYQIIKKDGNAKRATFETVHGTVQTPVFMNGLFRFAAAAFAQNYPFSDYCHDDY